MNALRSPTWGRRLLITAVLLSIILPLIWTVLASLKVQVNNAVTPPVWSLPPTLDSYIEIRSEQTYFWQELATSVLLSGTVALLTVTVSFLAAYALARTRFRWRELAVQSCLILASLPIISVVFPLGDLLRTLRLHDTFLGAALAESALLAPLAVYVLHGFAAHLPPELEEAAYIEGASLPRRLIGVVLPTLSGGVIATMVIVFALSWNQFFLPLLVTSTRIRVIPVMMRDFFALERDFDWTVAAAVLIVSLLPVSLLAAAAHRAIERFGFVSLVDSA